MRQPDDQARLLDMVIASGHAIDLASSTTYDEMLDDLKLQLALVKLLEIIGEAAVHVTQNSREAIDIPWRRIIGMRHRLVHSYAQVDYETVWAVVQTDLPQLIDAVRPHLRQP